jgi:hypothetical protein
MEASVAATASAWRVTSLEEIAGDKRPIVAHPEKARRFSPDVGQAKSLASKCA